jgi:hypothetical protein
VAGVGPGEGEEEGGNGSGGGEEKLAPVAGPDSQSLRKPGPIIVAALINIRGHGPAVRTVNVPQNPPRMRNTRSLRSGGSSRTLTHCACPSGPVVRAILLGVVVRFLSADHPGGFNRQGATRARPALRGAERTAVRRRNIGSAMTELSQRRLSALPW